MALGNDLYALAQQRRATEVAAITKAQGKVALANTPGATNAVRVAYLTGARGDLAEAVDAVQAIAGLTDVAKADTVGDPAALDAALAILYASSLNTPESANARAAQYEAQRDSLRKQANALRPKLYFPPGTIGGDTGDDDGEGGDGAAPSLTWQGLLEVGLIGAVGLAIGWAIFGRRR